MNLRMKVILLYLCIIIVVLICIGGILPSILHEGNLESVHSDTVNQLKHIDFALSNFLQEVKFDVTELTLNEVISNPDDTGFTSFIGANESTFTYSTAERENKIIGVLNGYRLSHPSVNSVYMGRETGTFVRSHKRPRPTEYDPRDRPWYILGKNNPGRVMMTDPYMSVTSSDINIGIVSAQTYPNGTVFGVLGADITLVGLTNYISEIDIGRKGEILLTNESGIILTARDPSLLFTDISSLLGNQTSSFMSQNEGMFTLENKLLILYTSPHLGWKYCVLFPFSEIELIIQRSIMTILLIVLIALILLSVMTLILVNHTVIHPLTNLTKVARIITETGDLNQDINIGIAGEIGELSKSLGSMISTIQSKELARKQALEDLAENWNHLEELVKERTSQLELANRDLEIAKERAEAADQLKSAFLATMSHELRTPMNSIIGFTGIILEGLTGPLNPEQEKQLGMVQNSARHLLALINDVLDISKIEAGELSISKRQVDINASILSVVKTMQPIADMKGLSIILNLDPDTGMVIGDQRRIEQILMNLMSNAVKFTETGSITICSGMRNLEVRISVADTGMGIAVEDLKTLFTPFHQIDTGTTRKYEGTGLGLSISKKLIELHNGRIEVISQPSRGSEFIVYLPSEEVMNDK
ncbi:MAG TPA: ATP-binding protein [Methanospirillum sp.]|nr:ATP-binding protein [Methanospirillum sp.]